MKAWTTVKFRKMKQNINQEFKEICIQILAENKSEKEWYEIESSDMFQTANYCGGFDGTEMEFTFSYYNEKKEEYWFQLSLKNIASLVSGELKKIEMRKK